MRKNDYIVQIIDILKSLDDDTVSAIYFAFSEIYEPKIPMFSKRLEKIGRYER